MPAAKKKATKANRKVVDPAIAEEMKILEQELARNRPFVAKLLDDPRSRAIIESQLKILPSLDGEDSYFVFRIERGGSADPGHFQFDFYPWWLGDWSIDNARKINAEIAAAHVAQLMRDQPGVVADDFLQSEQFREIVSPSPDDDGLAELFATKFIASLPDKISHALNELELELRLLFRAWAIRSAGVEADDGVDRLIKEMGSVTRDMLKGSIAAVGRIKWEDGTAQYNELRPKAAEARSVYEKHKTPNWRAMIKAGFPEFDEDLIAFLSKKPADIERRESDFPWTVDITEDYSLPSNMALEQAARNCGMKRFKHGPRSIREKMKAAAKVKTSRKNISQKQTGKVKPGGQEVSLKHGQRLKRSAAGVSAKPIVSTKIH